MLTRRVTQKSSAIALIVANVLIMRRLIVLIRYNVGASGPTGSDFSKRFSPVKPIFPRQHELKSNPSTAHTATPRSTPHASRPTPCKWILQVTGPHQWGEAETENCMSLTPHVESAEKRNDALLLHFGSKAELVDAINAVNGSKEETHCDHTVVCGTCHSRGCIAAMHPL